MSSSSSHLPITVSSSQWTESRDLVRLIYVYLTFPELVTSAIGVSHLWYQCGLTIPSRCIRTDFNYKFDTLWHDYELKKAPDSNVPPMITHHVSEARLAAYSTDTQDQTVTSIFSSTLRFFNNKMKNLQSLDLNSFGRSITEDDIGWITQIPSTVVKLELSLEISIYHMSSTLIALVQQLVVSCSKLESLTFMVQTCMGEHEWSMGRDGRCFPLAFLSELQKLRGLKYLSYAMNSNLPLLSDAHCQILRSFPSLTQLEIRCSKLQTECMHLLGQLLPQGKEESPPLHLIELPSSSRSKVELNQFYAPVLQQYQWLKKLALSAPLEPLSEAARFHTQFAHLTELEMGNKSRQEAFHVETLVQALSCMPHLRVVKFRLMRMTSAILTRCLSQLPELIDLDIYGNIDLNSFSFLRVLPHRTIKSIEIDLSVSKWMDEPETERIVPLTDFLQHIDSVATQWCRLERLELLAIFMTPVSQEIRDRFDWRSSAFDHARFPYLRQVDFGKDKSDDDIAAPEFDFSNFPDDSDDSDENY